MSRRISFSLSMRQSISYASLFILASIVMFGVVYSPVVAQQADLPSLAMQAAGGFQPVTVEQVEAARVELIQNAEAVDRWLSNNGSLGFELREYLEWDATQEQLASEKPNLAQLLNTQRLMTSDKVGLEQSSFRRTVSSLSKLIELSSASRTGFAPLYQRRMERFAKELERYQTEPTAWLNGTIAQQVDFLNRLGTAPELVQAIKDQNNRANLFADVSASFLAAAVSEPFDQVGDVRDCILGTTIRGTSHTTGHVHVALVPAMDRAILEFRSIGQITSQTRGYHSPVVVRSTGHTNFTATKRVEFTDEVFRVMPSTASATTRTKTRSVSSQRGGLFSGIISQIGSRHVAESKPRAERIAARHAERDIRNSFDEELLEEIKGLRRNYRDNFRYPLKRQDSFPRYVLFSSTSDLASAEMLQANGGQLAASSSPPPTPGGHEVAVRVHESAVCNYAAALIGGATLAETNPSEEAKLDVPLPEWIQDIVDEMHESSESTPTDGPELAASDGPALVAGEQKHRPWSITFRRGRPISLKFDDNQVTIIIHATRFVSGSDEFAGWDIIATYSMGLREGSLILDRVGEVELLPTSFDPGAGKGLSNRDVGIRSNLNKVINDLSDQGDGIPTEVVIDPITLSGELADVGTLFFQEISSDAGWSTAGLSRN